MLKTSGENWLTQAIATCSKRSAALVTGFARRYRDDIFFRTEANVIALQVAYVAIVLGIVITSLFVLYHGIVSSIAEVIVTLFTPGASPVPSTAIVTELELLRSREVFVVVALVSFAAVFFGYLVTRFALRPARNALNAQKQFIGNIAHELRTPLSIIKTNTEVRLLEADVTAAARTLHRSNLEELDRISNIINNLLSLNVLIQPEEIPFSDVDVVALARTVVKKLRPLAARKPIQLKVLAIGRQQMRGNASALEQIFVNIIKNAIQHTEQGDILVRIGGGPYDQIEISFHDSGAGIKRGDLYRVFEPFYRGDRSRTRVGGVGSGLGLAIVRELVKLHRGRVSIESAPGNGTTVTVTFPRHIGESSPADTPPARRS